MRTSNTGSHSDRPPFGGDLTCIQSSNSLALLIKELGNPAHDPPTPEGQRMLEQRIAQGDQHAREEICSRSLRYVFKVAGERACGDSDVLMECFSQGSLGALQASKRWNPLKGSFLTYADAYIQGAISAWLRKNRRKQFSTAYDDVKISRQMICKEIREEFHFYDASSDQEEKGVKAPYTLRDIELQENELSDLGNNPEQEVVQKHITLEWMELRNQLLEKIRFHTAKIKNIRHRKFFMRVADEGIPHYMFKDLLNVKVEKQNYTELHLDWYIQFLDEEFGEEVKNWAPSKISRKFTNTLNDIWRRQLRNKILQDEKVRVIICQMIEIFKNDTDLCIMF